MLELAQLKQEANELLELVNHCNDHSFGMKTGNVLLSSFNEEVDRRNFRLKVKILRARFKTLPKQF